MHLLKFLGVFIALLLAYVLFIPGLIWQNIILNRTGYRTIDLLWIFVPFASWVIAVKTTWRYVSSTNYWAPVIS